MARVFIYFVLSLLLVSCRDIVEKEADEQFALAETALHRENWDAADENFHEVILLDPDRIDAWIGRGMALTRIEKFEEARVHYEEALSICQTRLESDPLAPEPIRLQVMLLVLLDRAGEAEALAATTAKTHPDQEFARHLPKLVTDLTREFQEMILPATTDDSQGSFFEDPF